MQLKMMALLAAFLLALSACAQRGAGGPADEEPAAPAPLPSAAEREPADAGNESDQPESREPPAQEELDESAPPAWEGGDYQPADWNDWQEDPTSLDGVFLQWDHVEYRLFGLPANYQTHQKEFTPFSLDGSFLQGETITVAYDLPPYTYDDSTLELDLGFAQGTVKWGEMPPHYYTLEPGEDPYRIDSGNFDRRLLQGGWTESVMETETRDNVLGGICEGENYIRGIGAMVAGNIQVTYYIRLDETRLVRLNFYVSQQAGAEDLALYDAIADSVRIVTQTDLR